MKGVVEIEFIISIFVFITTVSFVTSIVISNMPLFHGASMSDTLKAKSWQYSEMLLFDEGAPTDWQLPDKDVKRIGLSNGKRYVLDKDKIDKLAALCSSGYASVKDKLGLDFRNDIIIEVSYLDDSPVTGSSKTICGPSAVTQIRPRFQTVRLGILNDADKTIIHIKAIII
ncbi:MAG TPA: hypothetical protein HA230_00675 [Candidatus Aenigmarchaeota archaeon]|nr:hypothetical protein [Candidatus Aenigmarchaeota archaeon]